MTPEGARALLTRSAARCAGPVDHHTRGLCTRSAGARHTEHALSAHCLSPSSFVLRHQRTRHQRTRLQPEQHASRHASQRGDRHIGRDASSDGTSSDASPFRASGLYGAGHLVQNRALGAYLHQQDAASGTFTFGGDGAAARRAADGQGAHC